MKENSEKDCSEQDNSRKRENDAEDNDPEKRPHIEATPTACAICFEGHNDGKTIMDHQCSQCKAGAWYICELCNESRLSRTCPLCNGDYAPLLLYAMPNESVLFDEYNCGFEQETKARALKAIQFAKLKLITVSNVVVWCPSEQVMKFSLPIDATLKPKDIRYMTATLSVNDEKHLPMVTDIQRKQEFAFSNRIWDSLEEGIESGAGEVDNNAHGDASQTCDIRGAMGFIMNALRDPTSVLYTTMSREDIQRLIDEAIQDHVSHHNSVLCA